MRESDGLGEINKDTNQYKDLRRRLVGALGLAAVFGPVFLPAMIAQATEVSFNCSVLAYHEVNANIMTSHLLTLINQGFTPISSETFIGALNENVDIPSGMRTFMVTCDDGLLSQYEQGLVALDRVQERTGIFVPMDIFTICRFEGFTDSIADMSDDVPSFRDNVHKYMNKGQLVDMLQRGHNLQNHTVDHKDLTAITSAQRADQVELAEDRLNELWQAAGRVRETRQFAYPYGKNRGQQAYIENQGFDAAFTISPGTQHFSSSRFDLGRLRRS